MPGLRDSAVVITGASSGVGRAAALTFARQGARLALAARRMELLERLAAECEALGAQAIAVPTDVGDSEAMRRLADTAAARLGPIRVWINNAGVGAVGSYGETPIAAHRRVIETNLLGAMNGAHAVLPQFFAERRGVLINTLSLGAWAAAPYAAAYATSKFGLRGFSESLRAELGSWPDIHVCDLFPSFLDTPGIAHGANYTGRALQPAPPVYDPQRVADAMFRLVLRPRPTVAVGMPARLARLAHALAPGITGWTTARFLELYLHRAAAAPVTEGNLFQPVPEGSTIRGGWQGQNRPLLVGAALLAGMTAVGAATAAVRVLSSSRAGRKEERD
ncbi:MAG TPA: SDR family oxidoreductase [Stellaceae bacterium]|nr:SDR family oxidoreductase [Stellaceae bacterium]